MMNVNQCNSRNYGIDILRILSMYMAVCLHILGQGGIISNLEALSLKSEIAWFLETCAYCAVNCFALISGYVGIKSQYRYTNLIILWIQTVFYTVTITCVVCLLSNNLSLNWELVGNMLFPVVTQQYWYFTTYFAVFIAIPIYNSAIDNIEEKQMRKIIAIAIVLFSVIPTITERELFELNNGYGFLWISFLYLIGAYIRKYKVADIIKRNRWLLIYFLCVLISYGEKYFYEYWNYKQTGESVIRLLLIRYISPTILMSAICLLCYFSKICLKDKLRGKIVKISSSAFAVYLIHAHPLVFNWLCGKFKWVAKLPLWKMLISFVGVTCVIFTVCIIIDRIRNYLFEKMKIRKYIQKVEEKLCSKGR